MRTEAEVLDGLTGGALAAEEDGVGAGGRTGGELLEREGLAAGGGDAGTGGGGEAQGGDGEGLAGGEGGQTDVVGDGADEDEDLVGRLSAAAGLLLDEAGERERGPVDLGLEEAAEDDAVEACVRAAGEEAVELRASERASEASEEVR